MRQAIANAREAETLLNFVRDTLVSDTAGTRNRDTPFLEVLGDLAAKIEQVQDQPKVELELRLLLGRAFQEAGALPKGTEHYVIAHKLAREIYGSRSAEFAKVTVDVAHHYKARNQGQTQGAKYFREAISIYDELGDYSYDALRARCLLAHTMSVAFNKAKEAEEMLRRTLEHLEPETSLYVYVQDSLAVTLLEQGRTSEAVDLSRHVIEFSVAKPESIDQVGRGWYRMRYSDCLRAVRQLDEAKHQLDIAWEELRTGGDIWDSNVSWRILRVMSEQGKRQEAVELMDQRMLPSDKPNFNLGTMTARAALVQLDTGDYVAAEERMRRQLDQAKDDDFEVAPIEFMLLYWMKLHNPDELRGICDDPEEIQKARDRVEEFPDRGYMGMFLAWMLLNQSDVDEDSVKEAMQYAKEVDFYSQHVFHHDYHVRALAYGKAGMPEAREAFEESLRKTPTYHPYLRGRKELNYSDFLRKRGELDEAEEMWREGIRWRKEESRLDHDHIQVVFAELHLADVFIEQGKLNEAEQLVAKAEEVMSARADDDYYKQLQVKLRAQLEDLKRGDAEVAEL